MGTSNFIEKQQQLLLKKFHTLLGKSGIGVEGKEAILHSYGVESSRDLSAHDLMDICNKLAMEADPKLKELDRWRKRVMAAIGGWLRATGSEESVTYIKSVACRAAGGCDNFNCIPLAELRNIYYEFLNKRKVYERVNTIETERLLGVISLN